MDSVDTHDHQQPAPGWVPTTHPGVLGWVADMADLLGPDNVVWCDGSRAEWDRLTSVLVERGTFVPLTGKPNSFWCASDPADVARVEDRTYICSNSADDAGPTNNWMDPVDMRTLMIEEYRGAMAGRTMYVIGFCMGPLGADDPKLGVQVTDSEYVAVSMQVMTRSGTSVWDRLGPRGEFVKCVHSVGAPLAPGQADVPWPCDNTKYITHFPETRTIWSYGSGYGGNALLGKKCFALRIASAMARDEGWLAEHMLILKLTSPQGAVRYVAAAFPSSCGKTNMAMLDPVLPGWTAETVGDDIAWLRFGPDKRLYAVNPEAGFFGVAPGTGRRTNPHAMDTIELGNSIFTNTALTDDGDVWWEGLTCTPINQCPTVAPEWDDPAGVPVSAILFGGRRASTVPLVTQSRDWRHGVFLASALSSETTAAAAGQVGVVRRDPMAMRPFLGYHVGDYLQHWLDMGAKADPDLLPKIFYVNWFRRSPDGEFLWPGFGENTRILKWILERVEGTADAVDTPIGYLPTPDALDRTGLDVSDEALAAALAVDGAEWFAEADSIGEWYETIGFRLPADLRAEREALTTRLHEARATTTTAGRLPRRQPGSAPIRPAGVDPNHR